jgi:hypothetical protein
MNQQFRDLNKLTQKRTRDAAASVLQLLEDDEERTTMLISCAIDFVDGAAEIIKQASVDADEEITRGQARATALAMLIYSFGPSTILEAFNRLKEARQ